MIGKLKGIIDEIAEDHVVLDVHGVGYELFCAARVLVRLPGAGEAATFHVEMVVREDMIRLYGFANADERAWFRLLTTVQGVGAKVALGLLGVMSGDDLARAVIAGDKAALARAPGVGRRLAERLVTELKDKTPAVTGLPPGLAPLAGSDGAPVDNGPLGDAVSALVNLGYGAPQAQAAVKVAAGAIEAEGGAVRTEVLIRRALRELAR